jgi:hypothetical protein
MVPEDCGTIQTVLLGAVGSRVPARPAVRQWRTSILSGELQAGGIVRICLCLTGSERQERGGPCLRLKLWQMGTYGVQMKGVLPRLVRLSGNAGARDFFLPWLF